MRFFFQNPAKKAKKKTDKEKEDNDLGKNIRPDRDTLKYETRELENLVNQVVPHFDKYPLQSNKQNDFVKFKQIVLLMKEGKHLQEQSLREILDIAYTMNLDNKSAPRRDKPKDELLRILADNLKTKK